MAFASDIPYHHHRIHIGSPVCSHNQPALPRTVLWIVISFRALWQPILTHYAEMIDRKRRILLVEQMLFFSENLNGDGVWCERTIASGNLRNGSALINHFVKGCDLEQVFIPALRCLCVEVSTFGWLLIFDVYWCALNSGAFLEDLYAICIRSWSLVWRLRWLPSNPRTSRGTHNKFWKLKYEVSTFLQCSLLHHIYSFSEVLFVMLVP